MKKDLRTVLTRMGASEAQFNSKIFHMTEVAIAEDSVDGYETVSKAVDRLTEKLDESSRALDKKLTNSFSMDQRLDDRINEAEDTLGKLNKRVAELNVAVDNITVKDPGIMDAINAYTLILTRTKEVLGEDALTEAVLVQLLETASYGLWRSIMGPKNVNDKRYQ